MRLIILCLFLFIFKSLLANPSTFYAQTSLVSPKALYQGFETDDELKRNDCLRHEITKIEGSRVVDAKLRNTSTKEASLELNINTGIGPSYSTFSDQSVRYFVSWLTTGTDSESFIYRSNIVLPSKQYETTENNPLNTEGALLIAEPQAFRNFCGDQFTTTLYYQGSLYIALQLHFLDANDKSHFTLSKNISAKDLSEKLPTALASLDQRGQLELAVFQLGGDIETTKKLFSVSHCPFSSPDACIKQWKALADYSNAFIEQFPSNKENPIPSTAAPAQAGALSYRWLPIPYVPVDDKLTPEIKGIRNKLFANSYPLYASEHRAEYLLTLADLNIDYKNKIHMLLQNILHNEEEYRAAGRACFIDLPNCSSIYNTLPETLKPLDLYLLTEPIFNNS